MIASTKGYQGKYQDKARMVDYLPKMVEKSAISKLAEDVEGLKKEKWWIKILPLVMSFLALILAILLFIAKGMR